jgi:hypothetical protein
VISLLFLSAVARGPGDAEIVYSARFYKQGAAKSYYHLYLSRLDGSGRRDLTPGVMDCMAPIWVDRDHVAYVEVAGWHWRAYQLAPEKDFVSIVLLEVRTRKKKSLGKFTLNKNNRFPRISKNKKAIVLNGVTYAVDLQGVKKIDSGEDNVLFRGEGVVVNESAEFPQDSWMTEYDINLPRVDARFKVIETGNYGNEFEGMKFDLSVESHGEKSQFKLKGMWSSYFHAVDRDRFFVQTTANIERGYTASAIYLINAKLGSASLIVDKTSGIDFDPDRPFWVGHQRGGRRLMGVLADGRYVWTDELQVGNWQSGERWALLTGLVNEWGYAFRPK